MVLDPPHLRNCGFIIQHLIWAWQLLAKLESFKFPVFCYISPDGAVSFRNNNFRMLHLISITGFKKEDGIASENFALGL